MAVRVAINGLGRIGRATLKVILGGDELTLVAVNDLVAIDNLVYLLRYDTVYGRYARPVAARDGALVIGGREVPVLHEREPANLPWRALDVDIVFECTGAHLTREALEGHLRAGAKRAILSAPAKSEEVVTIVHGASALTGDERIVSCASCTTNCITPVMEILDRRLGVEKAVMTTVHAYTATQSIVDGPNRHFRRGRAAAANFVPTGTGAAEATGKALPQFKGKFGGVAIRAPVPVGSIADIVCVTSRATTAEEVNQLFRDEAAGERYRDVVGVAEDPIVSSDIIGDSRASIVDLGMTRVVAGNLVKVMSWYDNEWGYSCQMVRHAIAVAAQPVTGG